MFGIVEAGFEANASVVEAAMDQRPADRGNMGVQSSPHQEQLPFDFLGLVEALGRAAAEGVVVDAGAVETGGGLGPFVQRGPKCAVAAETETQGEAAVDVDALPETATLDEGHHRGPGGVLADDVSAGLGVEGGLAIGVEVKDRPRWMEVRPGLWRHHDVAVPGEALHDPKMCWGVPEDVGVAEQDREAPR